MRKSFTRFLMVILLGSIFFNGYTIPSPPPISSDVVTLVPADNSTTQAQPGTGNVFVLNFTKDVWRLGANGVISLNKEQDGGTNQIEPIRIGDMGENPQVKITGARQVSITFATALQEDGKYHITITGGDAIQFKDGSFYAGAKYNGSWSAADWGFQVDDVTPPIMSACVSDGDYVNGKWEVSLTQNPIKICFSEPVKWKAGSMPAFKDGQIAFYTATKSALGEYGGDVIYSKPANVTSSPEGGEMFTALYVYPKNAMQGGMTGYSAIGNNVWPKDRDIYLRFAADLLVDRAGNAFGGINGNPFDPTMSPSEYWFSTRTQDEIGVSFYAQRNSSSLGSSVAAPLWENDDIVVQIQNDALAFIANGAAITTANAQQFLALSYTDGTSIPWGNGVSVKTIVVGSGVTSFIIEPGTLIQKKTIKVEVLGSLVQDKANIRPVTAHSATFATGDYTAPVIATTLNNQLCTNFDMRTTTDENGVVYYAIVKKPFATLWNERPVTAEDIVRGSHKVLDNKGTAATNDDVWVYLPFNYVADGGTLGQNSSVNQSTGANAGFVADKFSVTPSLTAFEHIDDFTNPNNGDQYEIYYFAIDPSAAGPYTVPAGIAETTGRISAVAQKTVQLTDCKFPNVAWNYEDTNNTAPWDDCVTGSNPILKQGKFKLKFIVASEVEGLKLVNANDTWEDAVSLEVWNGSWSPVEIASITPEVVDGKVVSLTVAPLNSYPSGGQVRVVLLSGKVNDYSLNVINQDIICQKTVEVYADPFVKTFTVETKPLKFPDAPEFLSPNLRGKVALQKGKITIEFNNPIYTPKRDEASVGTAGHLIPVSNVPNTVNYIGNYIKLREGNANDATVSSAIATHIPLSFALTQDANGGVTKVVITPADSYLSENWYYVEIEKELQDVNRVDLNAVNNNTFVGPHQASNVNNQSNYFIKFRSEDTIAPELIFTFNKVTNYGLPTESSVNPYLSGAEEDVNCIKPNGPLWLNDLAALFGNGVSAAGVPIGVVIKEWSGLGFDDTDYFLNVDPNGLRPYFSLKDADGKSLDFDVVVLHVWEPGLVDNLVNGPNYTDAVLFGFRPFAPLAEGKTYTMSFNANYQAPGSALAEGPVFVDDNDNALVSDTYVKFTTCSPIAPCFATTVALAENDLDPALSLTFPGFVIPGVANPYVTISDGTNTWTASSNASFVYAGNAVTIPWSAFSGPAAKLSEVTEYTVTVAAGGFRDQNYNTNQLANCVKSWKFITPDLTAPRFTYLSPDLVADTNVPVDPRNPGKLVIRFNEKVIPVAGKILEVWHNGTTKRLTYATEEGSWNAANNEWSIALPADFLFYNAHYHVNVEKGFVKDLANNEFALLTGTVDGNNTWTFTTGSDAVLAISDATPGIYSSIETIDPNLSGDDFVVLPNGKVQINKLVIQLSEKAEIADGSKIISIENGNAPYNDILQMEASQFTNPSGDGKTWVYIPTDLVVDQNVLYVWNIGAGIWNATDNENQHNATVYNFAFLFSDITAPTAKVWPTNGDTHVPFNAHGYVKFSEGVKGVNGSSPAIILDQTNIKSWIKVLKAGNPLSDAEYTCEFLDAERTHVRVTFLDENAPSINGVTANLVDETAYTIQVNIVGSNGYTLVDAANNALAQNYASTFTTEDITAPNFYVTTCEKTASSIKLNFTPWVNINPYGNSVDYPAEAGTAYYIVLPATATAPTADQLFNKTLANVKEIAVPASGTSATWTWPTNVVDKYNYVVYAVMKDDESDVFVAPTFGGAWVTTDPAFIAYADANPAQGAIGIADIRPAANKNMTVRNWNFCFCDDDAPVVSSYGHNGELNVPVNSTFEIKFNELMAFDSNVDYNGLMSDGDGTGDNVPLDRSIEFGHEIRLRDWNNNVSIPIRVKGNGTGYRGTVGMTGFIIEPVNPLDEETKYYIEVDRLVVKDQPLTSCTSGVNIALPYADPCNDPGCTANGNYFAGWNGRSNWWFQTNDNTAPVLTAVTPTGSCVDTENNQITFTFTEKNQINVANLTGAARNIYIYKSGEYPVPYEVIPANSAVPVRTSATTWTITYPTYHRYNSEEVYKVEWNDALFVDAAIPAVHNYTVSAAAVTVDGGDAGAHWDSFTFTVKDTQKPVLNWALLNTMWTSYGPDYVYPISSGQWDPNDAASIAPKVVNVCGSNDMPTKVKFVVWTNEDVAEIVSTPNDFRPFTLSSTTLTVSSMMVGPATVNGVTIPAGANYWEITPNVSELSGNTTYTFGISANEIKDVPNNGCTANVLPAQALFTFCTWNTEAPVMTLLDGKDVEITKDRTCVAERQYVTLKFNKGVVKTPNDGSPIPAPLPGIPWWTMANLQLQPADLMATNDGTYVDFRDQYGHVVEIDHVEVVDPLTEWKLYLKAPLSSEVTYTFEFKSDVVKDLTRIALGNNFPGKSISFTAIDWIAPSISELLPEDEASNVSPGSNLQITFNDEIVRGNGNIVIRDNGNMNGVIYTFNAQDATHVNILSDNKTVVINHNGLMKNTTYYVQVEPDFVREKSCGNLSFAGESEQGLIVDGWNFTTGDLDGPIASLWPVPGTECVSIGSELKITFDENINLTNKGQVVIYKVRANESAQTSFGDVAEIIPLTTSNFPKVKVTGTDDANGFTRNLITITPAPGVLEANANYYVRIVGDGVQNASDAPVVVDDVMPVGNSWSYPSTSGPDLAGIHYNQWYFSIGNNDAPTLVSTTPEHGEAVVAGVASAVTNLGMTFSKEVAFGDGTIKVYEFIKYPEGGSTHAQSHLWKTYTIPADVDNGKITLSDDKKTVTVNDVTLLDGINWYYVLVSSGAITNNVECTHTNWAGISNPDSWIFSTDADIVKPELTSNSITSDANDLEYLEPATVKFSLTFGENVSVANGTGVAQILDGTTVVSTAVITPAMIDGNTINFGIADFNNPILDQKSYTLVIGGDAIHDMATNSLSGKQNPFGQVPEGNENWFDGVSIPFMTGDFTAPTAIDFSNNGAMDLENQVQMVVTFDEPVQDGTGLLSLVNEKTGETTTFDAVNDEDTDPMTVTFSVDLADETNYHVLIGEGFVTDFAYLSSSDPVRNNVPVTSASAWKFGIDDNTVPAIASDNTVNKDNLTKSFDIVLQYNDVITEVDPTAAALLLDGNAVNAIQSVTIGTDPTQVIISVAVAQDMAQYTLDLAAGFVKDDAIHANSSMAEQSGPYVVGDRTSPILEAKSPTTIIGSYSDVNVMVNFFDDNALTVKKPILIKNSEGEVVSEWTCELDAEQSASTMPTLWFGTYTVEVPAGAVEDVNGNQIAETSWTFIIEDNEAPNCLTIVSPTDGTSGVLRNVDLEMEFCERMAVGNPNKMLKVYEVLEVQGELGHNALFTSMPITAAMIDGNKVTVPLTGLNDMTSYTVMIDADALRDEAGNAFEGINDPIQWNFTTGDNTAPTVVSVTPASSSNAKNSFEVTIKFSEEVSGVASAITVSEGEVAVSGSGDTYVATISGNDGDVIEMTIGTSVVDASMNNMADAVAKTYTIGDNTAPTVVVTDPVTPVNTVFTVGLTFNEPVSGVADAITVTGGKLDDVTGSGKDYVLTLSAKEQTSVSIVLGNTIKDTAPSANAFAGLTLTYKTGDFTAPALVTKTPTMDNTLSDTHPTFKLTFNEDVKLGAGGSLKVYKVATTTAVLDIPVTAAMINGKEVTVNYATVSPGLERSTRYYVLVDNSAITDVAGNTYAGVSDAAAWTFKTGANWPTPNIDQLSLEFKVYPNPFVDFVIVDNASQLSKIVVTNIAGQTVKEVVNPTDRIQLNELRSGPYFISMYNMDNVIVKTAKIVKR